MDAVRIIEGNSLGSKERNEILFEHLQPRTNKHHFFKLVTGLGQCKKAVRIPVRWVNCQSTSKCDILGRDRRHESLYDSDMSSAVAAFASLKVSARIRANLSANVSVNSTEEEKKVQEKAVQEAANRMNLSHFLRTLSFSAVATRFGIIRPATSTEHFGGFRTL